MILKVNAEFFTVLLAIKQKFYDRGWFPWGLIALSPENPENEQIWKNLPYIKKGEFS